MREMIAQYLPCYQTPTAVFLSPPVSNDSKQSSNSMTEKWSTMSADPPRTERLPGSSKCNVCLLTKIKQCLVDEGTVIVGINTQNIDWKLMFKRLDSSNDQ